MTYNYLCFDLDGTLTDSKEGILNSFRYAIEQLNHPMPSDNLLNRFIGPSLQQSFKMMLETNDSGAERAVKLFREYYSSKGIYENTPYPGISELLSQLSEFGKTIFVATAKLEKYARIVLDHFELSRYIDDLAGADYHGNHAEKSILIQKLIDRNQISDKNEMVMIGDTHYDMKGADRTGISKIAVGYGFGKKEELISYNPDHFAETVDDLYNILC